MKFVINCLFYIAHPLHLNHISIIHLALIHLYKYTPRSFRMLQMYRAFCIVAPSTACKFSKLLKIRTFCKLTKCTKRGRNVHLINKDSQRKEQRVKQPCIANALRLCHQVVSFMCVFLYVCL